MAPLSALKLVDVRHIAIIDSRTPCRLGCQQHRRMPTHGIVANVDATRALTLPVQDWSPSRPRCESPGQAKNSANPRHQPLSEQSRLSRPNMKRRVERHVVAAWTHAQMRQAFVGECHDHIRLILPAAFSLRSWFSADRSPSSALRSPLRLSPCVLGRKLLAQS